MSNFITENVSLTTDDVFAKSIDVEAPLNKYSDLHFLFPTLSPHNSFVHNESTYDYLLLLIRLRVYTFDDCKSEIQVFSFKTGLRNRDVIRDLELGRY